MGILRGTNSLQFDCSYLLKLQPAPNGCPKSSLLGDKFVKAEPQVVERDQPSQFRSRLGLIQLGLHRGDTDP